LEEFYEGLTLNDGDDEFIDVSPLKNVKEIVPLSKSVLDLEDTNIADYFELCVHGF